MFLLMKWSLNLRVDRKINNITSANQANTILKHLVCATTGCAFNILTYFGSDASYNSDTKEWNNQKKSLNIFI